MSDHRSAFRLTSTTRRRFLLGMAGLSSGAASLGALMACQRPAAEPRSKALPLIVYFNISSAQYQADTEALLRGLEARGYREGRTIQVERRQADSDPERWPATAQQLIDLRPAVIVLEGKPLVPVLLALTHTIPIVLISPQAGVEQFILPGWIKSQARPGGNLTGLVGSTPSLLAKGLDLLHETVGPATRLATLRDASLADPIRPQPAWTSRVISLGVSQPEDLDNAFVRFELEHAELLAISTAGGGSRLLFFLDQVVEQARRHRLPAVCDSDAFAQNGGLMSYAADRTALFSGIGRFVDKILRVASPADMPVELPATFRLVINKAAAGALGITVPPTVLAQATEVLE